MLPIALALVFVLSASAQTWRLEPSAPFQMPGEADSNSPGHWLNGKFYLYNSNGNPIRTWGYDPLHLGAARAVLFDDYSRPFRWIEATWVDKDGTVFAWYHHEPGIVCGEEAPMTAPKIGALVSYDDGSSFFDLGIVLEAGAPPDCNAQNGYFAGGHGDFSVILDRERQYFYFLFSNYAGEAAEQGVAIARMPFESRKQPVGNVWKFFDTGWDEPGQGGRVTPIFPATTSWVDPDTDAFWGPAIHWNKYLSKWVMLMNRICCRPGWPQEGVYLTFSDDLTNPRSWSDPKKLLDGVSWYPQVIGLGAGESDKEAGQRPLLFVGGSSKWELVFNAQ